MNEITNYWKALTFAAKNHGIKTRKDKETPYFAHPVRTAAILRAVGFSEFQNENLMIAALLHDLVEDTPITLNDIRKNFGEKVALIVKELTKPEKGDKEEWIRSFENASEEAKIIKMADRIDNLMDMDIDIWSTEKQKSYANQGKIILEQCGKANAELALKLKDVIKNALTNL